MIIKFKGADYAQASYKEITILLLLSQNALKKALLHNNRGFKQINKNINVSVLYWSEKDVLFFKAEYIHSSEVLHFWVRKSDMEEVLYIMDLVKRS